MKISDHFTLEEATHSDTAIRLGIKNIPNEKELENIKYAARRLEHIRQFLGVPLKVNSWFRCEDLNKAVGGVETSAHKVGLAIDVVPIGADIEQCYQDIIKSPFSYDQVIYYPKKNFIHIGFRYEYDRGQSWIKK